MGSPLRKTRERRALRNALLLGVYTIAVAGIVVAGTLWVVHRYGHKEAPLTTRRARPAGSLPLPVFGLSGVAA